jgi:hypothetical protein
MKNIIFELIKETLKLIPALIITGSILKLLLRHTLLGKIVAVILRDTWLFTKLCFKVTRRTGKLAYTIGKRVNKHLVNKLKDKNAKDTKKKVVNGDNVIDLKTAKELRHKWNK